MPRRGLHTKAEFEALVIATAARLIEEGGLSNLTSRKIAKDIGYTHGTVHQLYGNSHDIVLRVNAETLDQIYSALYKAVSKENLESKDIYALSNAYIDYGLAHRNRWEALYDFSYSRQNEDDLPDWYQERIEKIFTLLESRLLMHCDSPKDVKFFSQVLWSSLHGIAIQAISGKLDATKTKSIKKMTEAFTKIFVNGLKSAS